MSLGQSILSWISRSFSRCNYIPICGPIQLSVPQWCSEQSKAKRWTVFLKTFLSRVCENLDYCWLTYIENSLSPLLPFYKSFPIFQKALNQFRPHNIMHNEYLRKNLSLGFQLLILQNIIHRSRKKKTKADGNHMRRNADVWVLIGNPIIRLAC